MTPGRPGRSTRDSSGWHGGTTLGRGPPAAVIVTDDADVRVGAVLRPGSEDRTGRATGLPDQQQQQDEEEEMETVSTIDIWVSSTMPSTSSTKLLMMIDAPISGRATASLRSR